jgi:hypothetical protein
MARFVKTKSIEASVKQAASGGVSVPAGAAADRSENPIAGELRFNTDNNALEIYNGTIYVTVANTGFASITQDSFTGDGSTVAFTMSTSVTSNQTQRIVVAVGNVYQNPATAYTLSGTTITFTSPPGDSETITVIHGYDSITTA